MLLLRIGIYCFKSLKFSIAAGQSLTSRITLANPAYSGYVKKFPSPSPLRGEMPAYRVSTSGILIPFSVFFSLKDAACSVGVISLFFLATTTTKTQLAHNCRKATRLWRSYGREVRVSRDSAFVYTPQRCIAHRTLLCPSASGSDGVLATGRIEQ